MQLLNRNGDYQSERGVKTILLLCAVTFGAFEFFLPRLPFMPWLKPGLANSITLIWLIRYGFRDVLLFSLLRIWIISFYFGFSFITVLLALGGVLFSILAMEFMLLLSRKNKFVGIVGISVAGAFFHNIGQLLSVYAFMSHSPVIFYQIPIMSIVSTISGTIVAILAQILMISIADKTFIIKSTFKGKEYAEKRRQTVISILLLCGSISLIFISYKLLLICYAIAVTILVQYISKISFNLFILPLKRFWILFVFVTATNIFFSYGIRVYSSIPITYDGIDKTAIILLRLWSWLQTTYLFHKFGFNAILFRGLKRIFGGYPETLYAGLVVAEFFPSALDRMRKNSIFFLRNIFTAPKFAVEFILALLADTSGIIIEDSGKLNG